MLNKFLNKLNVISFLHKYFFFIIFFRVELLSKSLTKPDDIDIDPSQISRLIDMGFTEQQAQIALKRTKFENNFVFEIYLFPRQV
jgi:hypothetical protein